MNNPLFRNVNGRHCFLFALFCIFSLFFAVHSANADFASDVVDLFLDKLWNPIFWINLIFLLVVKVLIILMGCLVWFGAILVDIFLDPELYDAVLNDSSGVIQTGWETVRDFCNMFYIFFLLVIAFATITRNQSYSIKNLLPKVIISMFLINFSMVITKVVIDFGQVFFFGIAGWMGTFSSAGGGLTSIVGFFQSQLSIGWNLPTFSSLFLALFAVLYLFVLGLLYVMLAGFLLIRLILFVFLIIVSPFAFFSMVLPSMRAYSSKWWGALFKNAISGPIFIFFVYLSASMASSISYATPPAWSASLGIWANIFNIIIPHSICLGMLWMAIPATQQLGTLGSRQLIGGRYGLGTVAQGLYSASKVPTKAAGKAARKVDRTATAYGASKLYGAEKVKSGASAIRKGLEENRFTSNKYIRYKAGEKAAKDKLVRTQEADMLHMSNATRKRYVQNTDNILGEKVRDRLGESELRQAREQARINLLKKSGKLNAQSLESMGEKFENIAKTLQRNKAAGFDVGDLEKVLPGVIEDKDERRETLEQIVSDGEENKVQLFSLAPEDMKIFKDALGPERWERLLATKSDQERKSETNRVKTVITAEPGRYNKEFASYGAACSAGTPGESLEDFFRHSASRDDDFKEFTKGLQRGGIEKYNQTQIEEMLPHLTSTHLQNSSRLSKDNKDYIYDELKRTKSAFTATTTTEEKNRVQECLDYIETNINWRGSKDEGSSRARGRSRRFRP